MLRIFEKIRVFYIKYRFPINYTIILRLGLSLWMMLIGLIIDPYFPFRSSLQKNIYGNLTPHSTLLGRALLDIWLRWDAVHYMNIAIMGYSGVGKGDYNFPPLYPYLTLFLKEISFIDVTLAGLIISTIFTLLAFVFLYKFINEIFHDPNLARNSVLLYGLYPTSFFLFAPYTDSLYLFLTIAFFLLIYRRSWIEAGVLLSFASLTRIQGLLLIFPLITEILRSEYFLRAKISFKAFSGLFIAPIGFILFYLWRISQNIASLQDSFNQYSKIVFVNPINGINLAIRQYLATGSWLVLTELLSLLLFCAIISWMLFNKQFRIHYSMLIYSVSLLILFLSKHSSTASAMQSSTRYVIAIFPAFIGFGKFLEGIPTKLQKIIKLTSFTLLLFTSTLYAMWFFVG